MNTLNKPIIQKIFKFLLGLILALGIIYVVLALLAKPIPSHPFFDQEGVLVMAHRGGRDLWPENTLYAFEKAADLGVDVLEMDVHSTQDGVLVVIHDSTVDRTTDRGGPIQAYSLSELQSLDAGYHWTADEGVNYPYRGQGIIIPRLEEVFTALPNARMNIEIKQAQPSIVQPICEMIRDHGMTEQVLVASFDMDTIKAFRATCPEIATTAGEDEVVMLYGLSLAFLERLYSSNAEAVQVPEYRGGIHVLTPRFVEAAQGRGLDVHVWTVNNVADMQRFLDMGVNGIITDNPDILLALLGR